jgi:hypothetical protein
MAENIAIERTFVDKNCGNEHQNPGGRLLLTFRRPFYRLR